MNQKWDWDKTHLNCDKHKFDSPDPVYWCVFTGITKYCDQYDCPKANGEKA